jgi:hypothetical protein
LVALSLFATTVSAADTDGLITPLVNKLGITTEQAEGGAGSIFALAKEQLSKEDYASLAEAVPGVDSLTTSAPETGKKSGFLSSAMDQMGGTAALANQFS